MNSFCLLVASFAILCGECVSSLAGGQKQVTLRKCCPMNRILDNKHECVENESDKDIDLSEEVSKKIWVSYGIDMVNVTGIQCEAGSDYIARVLAVLTDDSLVLDLMNM